jgi:hypothetical protein
VEENARRRYGHEHRGSTGYNTKKKNDCFSLRRTYALPLSVFFLPVKHGRVALLSSPTPFLLSRPQAVSRGAAAVDVRQGVEEEAIVVVSRLLL